MLWILGIGAMVGGVLKICYHTEAKSKKIFTGICLVIFELLILLGLRWCFTTPTAGKQLKCYDVTGTDMFVYETSLSFYGMRETIPYTLRDISTGYTTCSKTDSSTAFVNIYEEKFSTAKFILGFKPEQNVFDITYNDNNNIY